MPHGQRVKPPVTAMSFRDLENSRIGRGVLDDRRHVEMERLRAVDAQLASDLERLFPTDQCENRASGAQ